MNKKIALVTIVLLGGMLAACGSSPISSPPTAAPTETPSPTATEAPTPTPTPAPIGGGTGVILYSGITQEKVDIPQGSLTYPVYQLERMDLETNQAEILITKEMLEEELGMELYQSRFSPSPDGSQVVISVATEISNKGPENYDNYLADPELNTLIPILDTGATFVQWTWSPDGSMLMGDTLIDNSKGILIVNNDGSGLRKVVKSGMISSPVWAPDSSELYTILLGKPIVTDLDGNESQLFSSENIDDYLITMSFSPDGERVAYLTESGEIYLAKSDFSEKIKADEDSDYKTCLGDYYPDFIGWSPDSTKVIIMDVWCVRNIGLTITDRMIQVDDGSRLQSGVYGTSILSVNRIRLCDWSPDGSDVAHYQTKDFDGLKLTSPSGEKIEIPYEGADCPTWIQ